MRTELDRPHSLSTGDLRCCFGPQRGGHGGCRRGAGCHWGTPHPPPSPFAFTQHPSHSVAPRAREPQTKEEWEVSKENLWRKGQEEGWIKSLEQLGCPQGVFHSDLNTFSPLEGWKSGKDNMMEKAWGEGELARSGLSLKTSVSSPQKCVRQVFVWVLEGCYLFWRACFLFSFGLAEFQYFCLSPQ